MALRTVVDEVHAGVRVAIDAYPRDVDAFAAPQVEELPAELVVAQTRDIGNLRTLPRSGDRRIGRVAAEALQILAVFARDLRELVQRVIDRVSR